MQNNSSDCGVFALLYLLHLRYGEINHVCVPVSFRMEMEHGLGGKVAGGLLGVRLALVEIVLSSATPFDRSAAADSDVIDLCNSD